MYRMERFRYATKDALNHIKGFGMVALLTIVTRVSKRGIFVSHKRTSRR